ncbi:MAG TPA: hypothetical protein VFE62_21165 [Gemmataceae bacterium]|nr:hypothetical protein [Gemmataceae bacterium]
MKARQYLTGPIGSYPDREEFQVDRVIVWVKIPTANDYVDWLDRADDQFPTIWQARFKVMLVAESALRSMFPKVWESHDTTKSTQDLVMLRGIWIDPRTGTADYDVWCPDALENWDEQGEEPSDFVIVTRDPKGALTVQTFS